MMEHIEAVEAERDALRRALAEERPMHHLARHLGPWEAGTIDGAIEWIDGRCRRTPAGRIALYTGTFRGVPMWGCLPGFGKSVDDQYGTEADADAWAVAQGWTLH